METISRTDEQAVREEFEQNHFAMQKLHAGYNKLFWFSLILGAFWFSSAFYVAVNLANCCSKSGAMHFYTAMNQGAAQMLLGISTIVFGWLSSRGSRLPSLIQLGLFIMWLTMVMLNSSSAIEPTNTPLLLIGIALHIWAQTLFSEDDRLKTQPGYPVFSYHAAFPAEYRPSPVVTERAKHTGTRMESINGQAEPEKKTQQPLPAVSQDFTLNSLYAGRVPGQAPPKLGPISLETQQVAYQPPVTPVLPEPVFSTAPQQPAVQDIPVTEAFDIPDKTPEPAVKPPTEISQTQISIDDLLDSSGMLSGKRNYQPHEEMLPSPEEVKQRLAAMKKERNQK